MIATRLRLSIAVTLVALVAGFTWWEHRDENHWTILVTNQRDAQVLIVGISGGFNESTGYTIVQPHASKLATVSHDDAPPEKIIIDFESHMGPNGDLIVVPGWQATKRALVCSWDEVQRYQPLIVTDDVSTCPGLARP